MQGAKMVRNRGGEGAASNSWVNTKLVDNWGFPPIHPREGRTLLGPFRSCSTPFVLGGPKEKGSEL